MAAHKVGEPKIVLKIHLTKKLLAMADEATDAAQYGSRHEFFRQAIIEKHAKHCGTRKMTAQRRQEEEGEKFCTMLGGTISDGVCYYTAYAVEGKSVVEYKQSTPLEHLTESEVSSQYSPSVHKVKEILGGNK